MRVVLRFGQPARVRRASGSTRKAASGIAALLVPVSVVGYVLAFWRIGADLGVAGRFGIENGLFSHWQVWMALGALLTGAVVKLNRYGNSGAF